MIKNLIQLCTIGAFAFLLASCEGNTTREWFIDNQSSEALTAKVVFKRLPGQTETIEIGVNSQASIGIDDALGGQEDAGAATVYLESISIISVSGKTVQKDYTKESSWVVSTEHRSRVPSDYYHGYTLNISDSDLE